MSEELSREGLLALAGQFLEGPVNFNAMLSRLVNLKVREGPEADLAHFLFHFAADEDIRLVSEHYSAYQREHLLELMECVRIAAPYQVTPSRNNASA
ncbi:MAG: hypothetical protein ABW051_03635 [Burkholderiaceae bacterium]